MIAVGLTGPIGAGKSTVTAMLAGRGAVILDADEIAREVSRPGGPAHAAILEHFGADVLDAAGALDRAALARRVFADPAERRALEGIVHPEVERRLLDGLEERRAGDAVVVLDIPLFVETDAARRYGTAGVLVVDAPEELCVERLVATRQMTADEARARLSAQADRGVRLRAADFVILNIGTLDELELMVDRAWSWIGRLAGGESGRLGP